MRKKLNFHFTREKKERGERSAYANGGSPGRAVIAFKENEKGHLGGRNIGKSFERSLQGNEFKKQYGGKEVIRTIQFISGNYSQKMRLEGKGGGAKNARRGGSQKPSDPPRVSLGEKGPGRGVQMSQGAARPQQASSLPIRKEGGCAD